MADDRQVNSQIAALDQQNNSPLGTSVFKDRSEIEVREICDSGEIVELSFAWKGSNEIRVPRWSVRKWFTCIDHTAGIIATLFPNDLIFLVQVDYTNQATAAVQVADIMKRAYDDIANVVCVTLNITEREEIEKFLDSVSWLDMFELFATIISQEINTATAEAILKKVQRLLIERFRLENGSFDFNVILGLAMSTQSSTDTPSGSS